MENEDEMGKGVKNTEYRKLDSRIGRWMSVDPAAELYYSWSPYNLSMNSPLANSDPSGATVVPPNWYTPRFSYGDEFNLENAAMFVPTFFANLGE